MLIVTPKWLNKKRPQKSSPDASDCNGGSGSNPPTTPSCTSGCTECSSVISKLKNELADIKCVRVSSDAHLEEAFHEINTLQEFVKGMRVKGLVSNVVNTGTHPHSPKSPLPIKHQHSPPALPPPNITQGVSSSTLSPWCVTHAHPQLVYLRRQLAH